MIAERIQGDDFVNAWLGVPFEWDGRSARGIDCWGLVVLFHRVVKGQVLPDWKREDHARAWIRRTIAQEAQTHWSALESPADGCICMVKGTVSGPHHVGIYWRGAILHAAENRGVVLERAADFMHANPVAEFGEYVP